MKIKRVVWVALYVGVLLLAVCGVWEFHGRPTHGIDDANIFFSYAENLAAGNGFRYAGNAEPVEGFTSMAWALICALIFRLGGREVIIGLLSVVLFVGMHLVYLGIMLRATKESRYRMLVLVFYLAGIISNTAHITWLTLPLMDTGLWAFVIACMVAFVLYPPVDSRRNLALAGFVFASATLVRPEGFLVAPILAVLVLLRSSNCKLRLLVTMGSVLFGSIFTAILLLTLFRVLYFGQPLPNTYYAKVSNSLVYNLLTGRKYLYEYLFSSVLANIALLLSGAHLLRWFFFWVWRQRLQRFPPVGVLPALSGICFLLLLVPVLSGGDHFAEFRFYQPAYAVIILLLTFHLQWFLDFLYSNQGRVSFDVRATAWCGFAVMLLWVAVYSSTSTWYSLRWSQPLRHELRLAESGIARGRLLADIFREEEQLPSIGVVTAGGIARGYSGPIIDLMGLNNRTIARYPGDRKGVKNHAAFEIGAFELVNVDVVLAAPPEVEDEVGFYDLLLKGMLRTESFGRNWRYGVLISKAEEESGCVAFYSKEFLKRLLKDEKYTFRDIQIWNNSRWIKVEEQHGTEIRDRMSEVRRDNDAR